MEKTIIDDILAEFEHTKKLTEIAEKVGCSSQRVAKVLSTNGIIINDTHDKILKMHKEGYSKEEIAKSVGMNIKTVEAYLPASRPYYNVDISDNAKRIKRHRDKLFMDFQKYRNYDLSFLTKAEREALTVMLDNPSLSVKDVANILGKSIETTRFHLKSAAARLEGKIEARKKIDYQKYKDYDLSILTDAEREVITAMIDNPSCSQKELAQVLGKKTSTMTTILSRALARLEGKKEPGIHTARINYQKYEDYDLSILTKTERETISVMINDPSLSTKDVAAILGKSTEAARELLKSAVARLEGEKEPIKPTAPIDYQKYRDYDLSILTKAENEAITVILNDPSLSEKDVAEILDKTTATVKMLLKSAVARLEGKKEPRKSTAQIDYQKYRDYDLSILTKAENEAITVILNNPSSSEKDVAEILDKNATTVKMLLKSATARLEGKKEPIKYSAQVNYQKYKDYDLSILSKAENEAITVILNNPSLSEKDVAEILDKNTAAVKMLLKSAVARLERKKEPIKTATQIDYQKYKESDLSILTKAESEVITAIINDPSLTIKKAAKILNKNTETVRTLLRSAVARLDGKKEPRKSTALIDYQKYRDYDLSILTKAEREALTAVIDNPSASKTDIAKALGKQPCTIASLLNRAVSRLEGKRIRGKDQTLRSIEDKKLADDYKDLFQQYADGNINKKQLEVMLNVSRLTVNRILENYIGVNPKKTANMKICIVCGKEFKCCPSVNKITCSPECRIAYREQKRKIRVKPKKTANMKICIVCVKEFKCCPSVNKITCSPECRIAYREQKRKIRVKPKKTANMKICIVCGKEFKCYPSVHKITCSPECRITYRERKRKASQEKRQKASEKRYRINYEKYRNADMTILSKTEAAVLTIRAQKQDMTLKQLSILCGKSIVTAQTTLSRAVQKLDGRYNKCRAYDKERKKEYDRNYYQAHKDTYRERSAAYYQKHREDILKKERNRRNLLKVFHKAEKPSKFEYIHNIRRY